ncbi:MAG: RagB/SusD family nutrient uptake outer membrane protein [Bacteroidales bacterium]|nr:RagB/SusD family nutrient uptake outer membrane protein [Bacteroidales bacterium]MDD4669633.1 RagB/SusD family nutrient uptake outer membrane protein [Bacteroidales bacterium]
MKKIFKIFACLTLLVSLASCSKDFLETSPTSSYDQSFIFTTTDNAFAALNGIHKSMVAQYYSRQNIGGYPSFQIAMDCFGEDLVFPTAGNGWWTNTGEVKWNSQRNANSWTSAFPFRISYKWISNANMIIDNIDNAKGSEDQKTMVKGQALAYRGMAYFWLVQLYGDRYDASSPNSTLAVPLVVNTVEVKKPLETVANIYAQIVKDLEDAVNLLNNPSNPYMSFNSKSQITAATAMGLRARVALAMQDWTNAKKYSEMAINTTSAKLMTQTQYAQGFNNADNQEWMWGFEMIPDQTMYFYGFMAYMSWNFNSSNIRGCPKCINSNLYDAIPATDIRKTLFDPTGKAWTMPTGSYKKYKYMNRKFAVADYASSVADANFMRLGEMYLIAAEACAKLNDAASAQNYLYTLNKTRDDEYKKSTKTGADLIEEIYLYRRIELWGEGFRFLDLKRLNLPLDRTGANHVEAVSLTMQVPADDIRWKFAIPQEEIDANDLIDKNVND